MMLNFERILEGAPQGSHRYPQMAQGTKGWPKGAKGNPKEAKKSQREPEVFKMATKGALNNQGNKLCKQTPAQLPKLLLR